MAAADNPAAGVDGAPAETIEQRLALVMNGGVSLAVWMGGVACEIDNVRRASNGIPPPDGATDEEKVVHDLWARAAQRIGARVTVDVIAGTSAGGLNGALLATAIARGASLADLKRLWLESGQWSADALLRPQPQGSLSLMNGDFFHDQIAGALQKMARTEHGRDVSLIVTSTALGPSSRTVRDSDGDRFSAADHRRRFHFSRHGSRPRYVRTGDGYELQDGPPVDDLADDEPLATAVRASASYPVAFAPVRETALLRERRVWPDWATDDTRDWLADGGILDNSPFDPVLESIQRKSVSSRWQRTLCFVVPSGDEAALGSEKTPPVHEGTAGQAPEPPPPWTSVAAAAFSFPGEANFRDDIDHLHRTIRDGRSSFDVNRFLQLTAGSSNAGGAAPPPAAGLTLAQARKICAAAIPLYRQSCAAAAIYQVRDAVVRSRPDGYIDPVRAVSDPGLDPASRPWLPDTFPACAALPTTWTWGADAADRVVRTMIRAASDECGLDELRKDLSDRLHQIAAIRQAVDEYLVSATDETVSLSDQGVVGMLDDAYNTLGVGAALTPIVVGAARAYGGIRLGDPDRAPDVLAAALAVEVSNGAGSLPDQSARPIFRFVRFGLDNPPPLLKAAYVGALKGQDGKPNDGSNILYGTRLNHFAAFADPDWRAWDWMWGRMTALAHLASVLGLTPEEVDDLTNAILAVEGRQLPAVQTDIGTVMNLTGPQVWETLHSAGTLPPALDALFDFIRSEAPTNPRLWKEIGEVGQIASDLFARTGRTGHVSHPLSRTAAQFLRRDLWKYANRTGK
jgi:patatin-related protein